MRLESSVTTTIVRLKPLCQNILVRILKKIAVAVFVHGWTKKTKLLVLWSIFEMTPGICIIQAISDNKRKYYDVGQIRNEA